MSLSPTVKATTLHDEFVARSKAATKAFSSIRQAMEKASSWGRTLYRLERMEEVERVLISAALRSHGNLRNAPGETAAEVPTSGVAVFKPRSYEVLISDAARSLVCSLDDDKTSLEIDLPYASLLFESIPVFFWPLPCNISPYKIAGVTIGSSHDDLPTGPVRSLFKSKEHIGF
ncbi:hypothetical protein ZIOFF_008086 [Zingiber officinale]|uniref:Uncharacterized protein n=1 Tax=Zingiber officinale TaxID=94328 RepID=A0A8J5I5V9_ZINOF|nr:hypothetical protein ZIOFF_008086 [Zingiber officinale]